MAEGPASDVVVAYLQEALGRRARRRRFDARRGARDRRRAPALGARRRRERRDGPRRSTSASPSGSSCSSSCSARPGRSSRSSSSRNDRGEVVFNALDTDARWRETPEPGTYTCTAWIPPNLLNEGVIAVDVDRRVARRPGATEPRQRAVDRHVPRRATPGSATPRKASSRVSSAAASGRCSTGRRATPTPTPDSR